jgi:signal transduction histidine kinase
LEKHISVSDEITLDYDQNVFSIGFTAMNMINPERNIYAYIMEGFEPEWNYGETKREVTYTNLDPGKYTFRVKAANNDGVWNEEGISLQINILPPWYRTNMFYVSLFLLLMAAPFTYYRLRTAALRRQKRRLTQVVAEKTLKLRKNNEALKLRTVELNRINYILEERQQVIEHQSTELENQASNLKQTNLELHKLNNTKDRLFSIIAHDLRSPFNTILGFSDLLIESVDKEDINQISNYARFVHDASLQVFNLLENLLCWARSQTNEIKYNPTNTDLDEIVHDNLDLLKESFLKKELKVVTDGYENYPVFVDLDMLRTILRNLLINAIKFTPKGGVISLKTEKLGNLVKLSVIDNGVGISKEDLQLLTIAGEQRNTKGTDGEFGSGLGLVLCNEFIIRNNGRLVIESEPGKGSTFSVLLPIK